MERGKIRGYIDDDRMTDPPGKQGRVHHGTRSRFPQCSLTCTDMLISDRLVTLVRHGQPGVDEGSLLGEELRNPEFSLTEPN